MRLSLWFSNDPKPELLRLSFERLPGKAYTSVRRKAVVDEPDAGSFQWTTAVRGLAALAVGTKIQSLIAGQRFVIQGEAKSLAASLDYAISKPTDWIVELFGRENSGKPTAPLLFRRENTERKRPGPVKVALNNALSESGAISIFLESKQLIAKTELERLLTKLTSAATNEDPWFSQAWFAKAISNELAVALNESDLLEGRVISKTVQRLSVNGKQPISLKTLTNQLRKNIPAPSQRYIGIKETSVAVLKEFGSTRFVCTPHQIGTLVLLKYLELEKTVPLAIDFSYPSTASIPKEKTAADSSLILSWRGALEL